ncbi:MAG: hypothetical protein JJ863_12505 [Deltaproteobacteria bacterium]|nr:hypothetical protein [Deltaproteobacteria bacterium]
MRFPFFALSSLALVLACSPSPRRITLNNNGGQGAGAGGGAQGNTVIGSASGGVAEPSLTGAPMQRLNQVDQHLTNQGFQRMGPAVRNANMQTGGLIAYGIDAQPGQCYVAVALAAEGSDLNMIVLDPMGRNVGHNVTPDPNPWVHLCANTGGRHLARLQMTSGQGEYFYALYQGPANAQPGLTALLGGQVQRTQEAVSIDSATQNRLTVLDQRLGSDRFQRVGDPQGVVVEEGGDTMRELNLRQGYCYAFASLGGQGAGDTDLFVLNADGEDLASDRSTDVDALVRFCPQNTGTYTLKAQMYEGSGPVFIAGWWQQQQAQAVDPAPSAPVIAAAATTSGTVDDAYALLDADMQARGYEGYGEAAHGQLQQGQTRNFGVNLEGGKCYAILAVGAGTVRNLDLIVADPNGSPVDQDVAADNRPIVRVCAENSGEYRMQVKMTEGSGDFVYHAYRWPRGTRGPFGLAGLIYVRLGEVTSLLSVEGFEPDANFAPGRGSLARQGASSSHTLNLPANECFAVLVVGGDGVSDLDVALSKGNNQLAGDGSRNAFPAVRYCTTEAGRYKIDVKAATGSGPYFYQVFRRSGG